MQHPTVPISQLAADINLDQLRPLFPLRILTALAIDDSTLGAVARKVGTDMESKSGPMPSQNAICSGAPTTILFCAPAYPRSALYSAITRGTTRAPLPEWYQVRYHRPQDDLTQPIDFAAATKFNQFFYNLTPAVADLPQRPSFQPGSSFRAAHN